MGDDYDLGGVHDRAHQRTATSMLGADQAFGIGGDDSIHSLRHRDVERSARDDVPYRASAVGDIGTPDDQGVWARSARANQVKIGARSGCSGQAFTVASRRQ